MVNRKHTSIFFLWLAIPALLCQATAASDSISKKKKQVIDEAWIKFMHTYITSTFYASNMGYADEKKDQEGLSGPDWSADVGLDIGMSMIFGNRFVLQLSEIPSYSLHTHKKKKTRTGNVFEATLFTYMWEFDITYKTIFSRQQERPTVEFVESVLRTKQNHSLLVTYNWSDRFHLDINLIYEKSSFTDDKYLEQYNLTSLNQETSHAKLSLKKKIFTRTELTFNYEYYTNHFAYDPAKNGEGYKLTTGIVLPEQGSIRGAMEFGIKKYSPRSSQFQSFTKFTGTGDVSFPLAHRMKCGIRYKVDHNFTYWDVNQYYLAQSVSAGLSYLITRKTMVTLQYQYGDQSFQELGGSFQTRWDIDNRLTFSYGTKLFDRLGVTLTYIYYRKRSTEHIFNQVYNFIGGQLLYEF
jgi:hypothetical protein